MGAAAGVAEGAHPAVVGGSRDRRDRTRVDMGGEFDFDDYQGGAPSHVAALRPAGFDEGRALPVIVRPVVELGGVEERAIWDRWRAEFAFRPGVHAFPGIGEPVPSATWGLATLNDDPGYLKLDRFSATVEPALATCAPGGESVLVLDWQHRCFGARPAGGRRGGPGACSARACWPRPITPCPGFSAGQCAATGGP
jgi:hypothetical protein